MKVAEKIEKSRQYLHAGGAHENPTDAILLLVHEQRATNLKLAFLLGQLAIIIVILLAHSIQGFL